MHRIRENQSIAIHRRVAALIADQPEEVIAKALGNLHRWTAHTDPAEVPAVYLEWHKILLEHTPAEIIKLLTSDDEHAARLRQSSPFAGVLDAREIWKIKRSHEAA